MPIPRNPKPLRTFEGLSKAATRYDAAEAKKLIDHEDGPLGSGPEQ